jgi:hypothetical protein
MSRFANSHLTITKVWRNAFGLYKKSLAKTWYPAALIVFFTLVSVITVNYSGSKTFSNQFVFIILTISLAVILFMVAGYCSALLLHLIYGVGKGKKASIRASILWVPKKYVRFFITMVIIGLLSSLASLFLVIPGMIVFALLAFAQPLILFENKKIGAALKGSIKLTRKNFWRTMIVMAPVLLLTYVISLNLNVAAMLGNWKTLILFVAMLTIVYPLLYCCILVQFNDLKIRKKLVQD